MSALKIGGFLFRPAGGAASGKKPEAKAEKKADAPSKGGYDTVNFRSDRLAVMPRMSTISGQATQHLRGEAMESLLRESASELDDYFSGAYGFDADPE